MLPTRELHDYEEMAAGLQDSIAKHLEKSLYVAYKLQLEELKARMHAFIQANAPEFPRDDDPFGDLTNGVLPFDNLTELVFTPRVMGAIHHGELKRAWIRSVVEAPCQMDCQGGLFRRRGEQELDDDPDVIQQRVLEQETDDWDHPDWDEPGEGSLLFRVKELVLQRPFCGAPAGTEVELKMDLKKGLIKVVTTAGAAAGMVFRAGLNLGRW